MAQTKGLAARIFGYTLLIINILAIVWLWLCYKASVTHPAEIKDIALFSLTTAVAIIANFVFIFIWLFSKRKWRVVIPVIALIVFHNLVFKVFAFNYFTKQDFSHRPGTVKIMSWNVHGLGIYNSPGNTYGDSILAVIKREQPDILCMPEFCRMYNDSTIPYTKQVLQENNFPYYRFHLDNGYGPYIHLGNTVFSKYPITDYKVYPLDRHGIFLLQCDIQLPGKMMRMFFLHLASYALSDEDRRQLSEMKAKGIPDEADIHESRGYLWRFNQNYILRSKEADSVARVVARSPYPVLICGDFNDMPASYTYNTVRGSLTDAFIEKGHGIGRTYNEIFPTLRIDHMFYDPAALHIVGFKSPYHRYSDHNALIANFEVR